MREQINVVGTLWRCSVAPILLYLASELISRTKRIEEGLLLIAFGLGLIAYECWARLMRRTLVRREIFLDVYRRGKFVKSIPIAAVRYWSWLSYLRSIIGPSILTVLAPLATGAVLCLTGNVGWGVPILLLFLLAVAGTVYQYRNCWTLQIEKSDWGGGNISLAKPDVVSIFGFWPADPVKQPRQGQ